MTTVMDMTGRVVGRYSHFRVVAREYPDGRTGISRWRLKCNRCGKETVRQRNSMKDACGLCMRGRANHGCDVLYVACTADRLELPVVVTDTLDEMAQTTGLKKESILQSISRLRRLEKAGAESKKKEMRGSLRYYRVELKGEERKA